MVAERRHITIQESYKQDGSEHWQFTGSYARITAERLQVGTFRKLRHQARGLRGHLRQLNSGLLQTGRGEPRHTNYRPRHLQIRNCS